MPVCLVQAWLKDLEHCLLTPSEVNTPTYTNHSEIPCPASTHAFLGIMLAVLDEQPPLVKVMRIDIHFSLHSMRAQQPPCWRAGHAGRAAESAQVV